MKNSHTLSFLWIHSYLTVDCNPTQSGALCDRALRWRVEIPNNAALWMILLLMGTMSGMAHGDVTLVSADAAGVPGNRSSIGQSISADGRFVAFASKSNNLVPEDTNGFTHVFLKNVETGEIVRVSQDARGVPGNRSSIRSSISADGGFVAFGSTSTNLVQGDTNDNHEDVYVKNVETGEIVRVSQDAVGVQGNGHSFDPSISADGRLVAFGSTASNLVPEDTNGFHDVFVKIVETGEIVRVSQDAVGVQGNGSSDRPSISADGRFVAFGSTASNLVPEDTNDNPNVFVKNVVTGEIIRVNEEADGAQVNRISVKPSISADGRFVAFDSDVNNLEPGDTTDKFGVSVKNLETGEIVRVSAAATEGAGPSISADGRFVAFESFTSNLVPEDINDNEFGEDDVFLANVAWPDAATLILNLRYAVYSGTAAEVFWDRAIDNGDVLYEVTRNGTLLGAFDALSVFEDDLRRGMQYTYTVTVIDNHGNRLATDTIDFTTNHFAPNNPSTPGDLTYAVYSSSAAEVFWDRSSDDGYVQGYEITRNVESIGILDVLSVFDDDLIPGVNYTYTVTAIDNDGNRSATVTTSLMTGAGSDSNFPTGIRSDVYSATAAELFWNRQAAFGITYEVERDGVVLGQTDGVSYFDDSLSGGEHYHYRVTAIDSGGNRSEKFAMTFLTTAGLSE